MKRFKQGRFPALAVVFTLLCASEALADEGYPPQAVAVDEHEPSKRFLHGFRLGYIYMMNSERRVNPKDPKSETWAQRYKMRTPHQFALGYEVTRRTIGHDWLNVLVVGNVTISGLEQSRIYPSANGIIGFEFDESFQLGVGVNLMPARDKAAHMLVAAGWTPRVGTFHTPVHMMFVPDVDGTHRFGVTVGVNQ